MEVVSSPFPSRSYSGSFRSPASASTPDRTRTNRTLPSSTNRSTYSYPWANECCGIKRRSRSKKYRQFVSAGSTIGSAELIQSRTPCQALSACVSTSIRELDTAAAIAVYVRDASLAGLIDDAVVVSVAGCRWIREPRGNEVVKGCVRV